MATIDIGEIKHALRKIVHNIDEELYSKLREVMSIPSETYEELDTAELYFIELLLKDELRPWYVASCFKNLGYSALGDNIENFAKTFNFPKEEPRQSKIDTNPEIALLKLLKQLKSNLTNDELYAIRETKSKTFEHVFSDFFLLDKLTPSLEILCLKLQKANREDLSNLVSIHAEIISKMIPVRFEQTFRLCLDTLDVDIFTIISDLRSCLRKEFSSLKSLSIPLTFTEEQKILTGNIQHQSEKPPQYVYAHTEIYSPKVDQQLISLIGHSGSGKTFYCKNIINEFANNLYDTFRFILLLSCRDSQWHTIEETYYKNPNQTQDMLHNLLSLAVPSFNNSHELVPLILKMKGSGLLLLIDSFDEFPSYEHLDYTLLYKILKRQVLNKATVLITSRPRAWDDLLSSYKKQFEFQHAWKLIGFVPEQRDQFILKVLSYSKADLCRKFLENKPELNIVSLVPLNINLLTGLIDSTELLTQVNTLTDVYTSIVLSILNKELNRIVPHSFSINSIQGMPADMRTVFDKLAELCYNGLIARKFAFSQEEFAQIHPESHKYLKGLGLFHVKGVMDTHFSVEEYFSCSHLTFQEFLSAWHLSQKSSTELVTIINKIFTDKAWHAMKVCIRFLCGILTQSHNNAIIPIIIDNLHNKSAIIKCTCLLFNSNYYDIHYTITESHLSVLPYVLETQDSSIISSYHQLMCPDDTTMPHFYLSSINSPVDAYYISEFTSKQPQNSIASVLTIYVTGLSTTKLDILHKFITSNISIDTLIVEFSLHRDTSTVDFVKEPLSINIEDILYEVQQLHINSNQLVKEIHRVNRNTRYIQYILSSIKFSISNLNLQKEIDKYQSLFHFIDNITNNASIQSPKHINYMFSDINLMDDMINNALIDGLQSSATHVSFYGCAFTPMFMIKFVTSQPKLAYLAIHDWLLVSIRRRIGHPTIEKLLFDSLNERTIKGLYLSDVALNDDTILYNYLQNQTCLQEIQLRNTTRSTSLTLTAIKHMSSLHYIDIEAKEHLTSTEEFTNLSLSILNNNLLALSYVDFSTQRHFLTSSYDIIMSKLCQCQNLQYISFYNCNLTADDMEELAKTINSMHALVYINISYNSCISDSGLIELDDPLDKNNTIRHINLDYCDLSSSSIPVIESLINKCASLLRIELDGTKFTDANKRDLEKFAQQKERNLLVLY